jgi:predicted lipoprotein with Yx(FWY)xxD motif
MRGRFPLVVAGCVAALALVAAGCGSSKSGSGTSPGGASTAPSSSSAGSGSGNTVLGTASTPLGTVVTDASGRTLYYFSLDTASSTGCVSANCVALWPPLLGSASVGASTVLSSSGVGSLTRPNGTTQATYLGHPLYRYSGDTGPDQTNGQGISDNGGTWHVVLAQGSPATSTGGSSGSSGGYGGGY